MQLERGQIHSLLLKVLRELYKYMNGIAAKEIELARPRLQRVTPCCFFSSVTDPSIMFIRNTFTGQRTEFGSCLPLLCVQHMV